MMDDRNSTLRNLLTAVTTRPQELPVAELVAVVGSRNENITLDLTDDPAIVLTRPRPDASLSVLTNRERDVARLVAAGYPNRQIADALFISLGTVKDHVHSILHKTGFDSRSQIIAAWLGSATADRYRTGDQ